MTNPYNENMPIDKKAVEELRLIRCLLERLLRCMNESNFVDYQMEKFGKRFTVLKKRNYHKRMEGHKKVSAKALCICGKKMIPTNKFSSGWACEEELRMSDVTRTGKDVRKAGDKK